ncbi:MAG: FHA domain-containing protein, partial [Myxococcota bacterium]
MPTALKLTVHHGEDVVAQETFERDIVKIGRLASAHLKLDDPKVSRIHAVIEATNDGVGYAIIDMGSTEGTVLNGRKISKERLSDGDELWLGDLRVLVNMALDAASLEGSGIPAPPRPASDASAGKKTPPAEAGMPPVPPATSDVAESAAAAGANAVDEGDAADVAASAASEAVETKAEGGAPSAPTAAQSFPAGLPPPPPVRYPVVPVVDPWGSVPNNLASDAVPPRDRMLEIRTVWGTQVLDTFTVSDQPRVTIGDDRRVVGWGPFQRIDTCDIQVP